MRRTSLHGRHVERHNLAVCGERQFGGEDLAGHSHWAASDLEGLVWGGGAVSHRDHQTGGGGCKTQHATTSQARGNGHESQWAAVVVVVVGVVPGGRLEPTSRADVGILFEWTTCSCFQVVCVHMFPPLVLI